MFLCIFSATDDEKLPLYANMLAGSTAGFIAKAGIYPFDLAKKRLQVQGFENARSKFGKVPVTQIHFLILFYANVEKCLESHVTFIFQVKKYSGLRHCLIITCKEEGIRGLYKGFVPSTIKAMMTSGLIFALYEEITHLLVLINV